MDETKEKRTFEDREICLRHGPRPVNPLANMSPSLSRRYQVFVSSTYEDLIEERRHVIQALLETRCIPCGMELFPASTEEKWALIKRLIDDCDYFITIIAGMYGSSPTADGASFTEMEFDYALQRGMRPIGFFYADIGCLPSAKVERFDAKSQKLEAFTRRVREGMCAKWLSAAELGSAVKSAMINAFEHDPKPGWMKAKTLASAAELSAIREIAGGRTQTASAASAVLGKEILKIPVVDGLQLKLKEKVTNHGTVDYPLGEIFAAISVKFDGAKPAGALNKMFLRKMASKLENMNATHRQIGRPPIHWEIPKGFFDRVLKTFMAKGLLRQVPPPKHLRSRKSLYWELTSSGRRERARLDALL